MKLGQHVEDRDRAFGGELFDLRVGACAHANGGNLAREDAGRIGDRLAA